LHVLIIENVQSEPKVTIEKTITSYPTKIRYRWKY